MHLLVVTEKVLVRSLVKFVNRIAELFILAFVKFTISVAPEISLLSILKTVVCSVLDPLAWRYGLVPPSRLCILLGACIMGVDDRFRRIVVRLCLLLDTVGSVLGLLLHTLEVLCLVRLRLDSIVLSFSRWVWVIIVVLLADSLFGLRGTVILVVRNKVT